jgi:Fic family protein
LGEAQHGSSDVSEWVQWFANVFCDACRASIALIDGAIEKARFWASHSQTGLNERQRKVVQRLLDDGDGGFLGGLNAEKYTKMTGASKPTATRDMAELVRNGMLRTDGLGKAMRYYVVVPGWTHGVKSESMD